MRDISPVSIVQPELAISPTESADLVAEAQEPPESLITSAPKDEPVPEASVPEEPAEGYATLTQAELAKPLQDQPAPQPVSEPKTPELEAEVPEVAPEISPEELAPEQVEPPADTAAKAPAPEPIEEATKLPKAQDKKLSEKISDNIRRDQLALTVDRREPSQLVAAGETLNGSSVVRLFYFNEFADMNGAVVTHFWLHKGKVVAKVPLKIKGDRWRTYSSKYLPVSQSGEWRVEVRDEQNNLLAYQLFYREK
ncbi:DUF2914 domain-containing protein [Corallincola platygyrae]|uniref:DUF2914 domain-containing protein n=1 Tax=Corallincola platygyrae TaxID=1193278 RepID=A0ABW4XMM8_9GAMM